MFVGELETRTKAYQTRIMELEASAAKDRESMIALQISFDELNNEKVSLSRLSRTHAYYHYHMTLSLVQFLLPILSFYVLLLFLLLR